MRGWSRPAISSENVVSATRTSAGQGPIPPGEGTDSYAVVNLSGEYRVVDWARVFANVQNVFDDAYVVARRPAGAHPGLPRTVLVGVRLVR